MPKEPLPRYLHPNYDPMKDKMDRLREILIHNKVKTPSGNVRKQDFVDLFEEHIRPQVPALREYYNSIVPSEEGIIKVPASAMTSLLNTKPSAKIPTQSRSTTAGLSSQKEPKSLSSSTSTMTSPSSAPLLKQSVPQDEPSGTTDKAEKIKFKSRSTSENEESRTSVDSTRGRKSRTSTSIRGESDTDGATSRVRHRKKHSEKKKKVRSDNFSDENPFQSNSESERRRRSKSREHSSTSRPSSKSRSSRSRRRSHDEGNGRAKDHDNAFILPSQPPFSSYMHTPKYTLSSFNRADLDAGPFHSSPLLAKSRRISATTLAQPKPVYFGHSAQFQGAAGGFRRYNEIQQRNSGPLRLIAFFAAVVFGMWYRQARFRIGFCTATNNSPDHNNSWNQQTWDWIYPTCIPCPTHAICSGPHEIPTCPPEYILKPHPLSFGNFLPLTPECVLNRAKEYQSLQVADVIEQILHQKAGIEECKVFSQPPKTAELLSHQRISINQLREEIEAMKDVGILEIKDKVMVKASGSDTVIVERGIGGLLIRRHVLRRREEERVIHSLVNNVLNKLADQSHYHYIDPVLCLDPYLPQIHLRDALLTNVQTPARRQELWDKVSAIVDRNANVRVSAQEVRGEIHRVWEWIGASGVLSMKAMSNRSSLYSGDSMHSTSSHMREKPTMVPPQSESHDSLFGSTGDSDLEFVNPARSLYPSLLKEL
ncbi:inner nuclear membrane protein enriched at telomere/subtelomere region [Entomortierella chlamydospora]|uniref:Inner nuclear membrane protein enriched at telomere/subtelomere region n=1 Tax=Entomortierella chlamydospora TaxID=101097 RepID=A0A9P6N112_9FUNG|nr:inner nuclear membrane protein enriched at telomere/subtelomere region [Entomortierella chlamydospora]